MKHKTEKFNLSLSIDERADLDRLAKSRGLTRSQFIRSAIRNFERSLIAA